MKWTNFYAAMFCLGTIVLTNIDAAMTQLRLARADAAWSHIRLAEATAAVHHTS